MLHTKPVLGRKVITFQNILRGKRSNSREKMENKIDMCYQKIKFGVIIL